MTKSVNNKIVKRVIVFCILTSMLALLPIRAENYASSEPPVEGRGIWVYATSFKNAEELIGNFTLFKSLNLNIIFFLVKGWKPVYFNSSIRPIQPTDWDPLKVAVEKAHELGLELHAWFVVFRDPYLAENKSLATVYSDGRLDSNWACPANPIVRSHLLKLIEEVVANYNVDGIHLDYIRYNNSRACYCEYCREAYKNETGREPPLNSSDPDWDNWTAWRIRQVTSFVQEAHALIKSLKPNVKLSAYVFSNITDAVHERFQNWTDWIQKGFVDFLVPGAYTKDMKDFKDRVSRVLNVTGWQVPIYMGIGVHAFKNEVQIPERIVEQINITRTLGAEGQVFFRWFGYSDGEYLPLNNELAKALKIAYHNQTYIPHKLTRLVDTLPSIVYSNSTIKSLHFNFTEKSIMIQVTGPKGTTGFTSIKLPQTVMDNDWSGNVTILLDGTPWPFTKVIAYNWTYLTAEYGHEKVHEIKIMIPEFSTLTLTIFILTILLLCIFIFMKRENISSTSSCINVSCWSTKLKLFKCAQINSLLYNMKNVGD
jgi:uncharacterized lipoprotein YddW (UPF0748 family)